MLLAIRSLVFSICYVVVASVWLPISLRSVVKSASYCSTDEQIINCWQMDDEAGITN